MNTLSSRNDNNNNKNLTKWWYTSWRVNTIWCLTHGLNFRLIVKKPITYSTAHQVFTLSNKMQINLFSASMLLPHPDLVHTNAPNLKEQRSGKIRGAHEYSIRYIHAHDVDDDLLCGQIQRRGLSSTAIQVWMVKMFGFENKAYSDSFMWHGNVRLTFSTLI